MKRDRRQCQGIMVCSEAFKNGDDVTQLEMICISETYTPFPRTFGKSATSNGSFFSNPQTPPVHWIPCPDSCCGVQGAACKGE